MKADHASATISLLFVSKEQNRPRLTVPRDPSQRGKAMGESEDARRRTIICDPRIHQAILKVARSRGVPWWARRDLLQDVLEAAWTDPNLPLEPEPARPYMCAVARHKAIDSARSRKRTNTRLVRATEDMPAEDGPSAEEHVLAQHMLDAGKKLFPSTMDWLRRSAIEGESHESIAADVKKSSGYVRHKISRMRVALASLAVLFAIGIGMYHWQATWLSDPIVAGAPRAVRARAMRAAGKADCETQEWHSCWLRLDAARRLDPAGDTAEWQKLREVAEDNLRKLDAGSSP